MKGSKHNGTKDLTQGTEPSTVDRRKERKMEHYTVELLVKLLKFHYTNLTIRLIFDGIKLIIAISKNIF